MQVTSFEPTQSGGSKTGLLAVLGFLSVALFITWYLVSTIIEKNRRGTESRQSSQGSESERPTPREPITIPDVLEPGLQLTFAAVGGDVADSCLARMVALHVPRRSSPSPFLPPGRFRATWQGFIGIPLADRFNFRAEGKGGLVLTINGVTVLDGRMSPERALRVDGIEFRRGANAIHASFTSDALGEATLRLYWSSPAISIEPIPPTVLSHDPEAEGLLSGLRQRRGRALLAERRCTECHQPTQPFDLNLAMPELGAHAPSFADIGERLNAQWMVRWILNPRSGRERVTMPRLFPDRTDTDLQSARDIAAYLTTLGDQQPFSQPFSESDVDKGASLFQELGCIACHVAPDGAPADVELGDRIQLDHIRAKWQPAALQSFLQQPRQYYAWIRMPDFQLVEEEASALAAYLIENSPEELELPFEADVDRGRELVQSTGCVNCHDPGLDDIGLAPAAFPTLAEVTAGTGGCLAEDPAVRGAAPDFDLDAGDRAALVTFLSMGLDSLGRHSKADFAQRQLEVRRCTGCHDRDGISSTWSQVVERDVDSTDPQLELPQDRPSLTWVGEKLRPSWMTAFVSGELETPRPWLVFRMPAFPVIAPGIVEGLTQQHGRSMAETRPEEPNASLATTGRRLVVTSFNCVTCHGLGGSEPTARVDVEGINFALVTKRLRKDYFLRWMADPPRTEPGSRMPRYASGGRTGITETFGGDAGRQFEAMWHYLLAGSQIR